MSLQFMRSPVLAVFLTTALVLAPGSAALAAGDKPDSFTQADFAGDWFAVACGGSEGETVTVIYSSTPITLGSDGIASAGEMTDSAANTYTLTSDTDLNFTQGEPAEYGKLEGKLVALAGGQTLTATVVNGLMNYDKNVMLIETEGEDGSKNEWFLLKTPPVATLGSNTYGLEYTGSATPFKGFVTGRDFNEMVALEIAADGDDEAAISGLITYAINSSVTGNQFSATWVDNTGEITAGGIGDLVTGAESDPVEAGWIAEDNNLALLVVRDDEETDAGEQFASLILVRESSAFAQSDLTGSWRLFETAFDAGAVDYIDSSPAGIDADGEIYAAATPPNGSTATLAADGTVAITPDNPIKGSQMAISKNMLLTVSQGSTSRSVFVKYADTEGPAIVDTATGANTSSDSGCTFAGFPGLVLVLLAPGIIALASRFGRG